MEHQWHQPNQTNQCHPSNPHWPFFFSSRSFPIKSSVPGTVDISQCMVMAELFTVDQQQPCSLVANPATTTVIPATPHVRTIGDSTMSILHLAVPPPISTRNLTGSTGASGDLLKDLTGNYGIFFAFPDLSVRTDGIYTLKFSFVMLPE